MFTSASFEPDLLIHRKIHVVIFPNAKPQRFTDNASFPITISSRSSFPRNDREATFSLRTLTLYNSPTPPLLLAPMTRPAIFAFNSHFATRWLSNSWQ